MKLTYPPDPFAHGGRLRRRRSGRGARPLSTRSSMHLVLRSSRARGQHSFRAPRNQARVEEILYSFARKRGVTIQTFANNHNHLHLQVRLKHRDRWDAFIRAVTSAIAYAIQGRRAGFWDHRPFTRVTEGARAERVLRNYVELNWLEAIGFTRARARRLLREGVIRCEPGP